MTAVIISTALLGFAQPSLSPPRVTSMADLARGQEYIRRSNAEVAGWQEKVRQAGHRVIAALSREIAEADRQGNTGHAERLRAERKLFVTWYGEPPK